MGLPPLPLAVVQVSWFPPPYTSALIAIILRACLPVLPPSASLPRQPPFTASFPLAQRYEVQVQPGDIVVLGTDGLWDNCFNEEILSVLKYCMQVWYIT